MIVDDKNYENLIDEIVRAVKAFDKKSDENTQIAAESCRLPDVKDDMVTAVDASSADEIVTDVDAQSGITLENPEDLAALLRMKGHTSARIGIGKAGARLKTQTMLKLRLDHAAARDAVFTDVNQKILDDLGLKTFSTVVKDKNEFLTRPDLGRRFSDDTLNAIKAEAGENNDVLIYASDGLSSTAVDANVKNILPVLYEGLKQKNLKVAKPFFVKFGRVAAEDAIAEITKSSVICALIGERPGLQTAESMSAYICYKAYVGQPEARRTVVSNIHKGGTMAIEAGAYIVDVIEQILQAKASGVELKKQGDVL